MLQQQSGTFLATGSDLYVCPGFVPDWVELMTIESTDEERSYWDRNMRTVEFHGGYSVDDDGTVSPVTIGVGIAGYKGGLALTAASTVYLQELADQDVRDKGTGGIVSRWILDTVANRTGHFNNPVSTTYVGVGSEVVIGKEAGGENVSAWITAITSNGEAADEITLSEAISSDQVLQIRPLYDYMGAPAGTVTKAGFFVDSTAAVNTSGQTVRFKCGMFN